MQRGKMCTLENLEEQITVFIWGQNLLPLSYFQTNYDMLYPFFAT